MHWVSSAAAAACGRPRVVSGGCRWRRPLSAGTLCNQSAAPPAVGAGAASAGGAGAGAGGLQQWGRLRLGGSDSGSSGSGWDGTLDGRVAGAAHSSTSCRPSTTVVILSSRRRDEGEEKWVPVTKLGRLVQQAGGRGGVASCGGRLGSSPVGC